MKKFKIEHMLKRVRHTTLDYDKPLFALLILLSQIPMMLFWGLIQHLPKDMKEMLGIRLPFESSIHR